uniref:Uncharacterized protein n=1 Tax=Micrurus spixii TaxID=129469 RepID=A0A2D4LCH5_9SAUR
MRNYYDQVAILESKVQQYLQEAELPRIPDEVKTMLDEKITMMELTETINRQNIGKAPSPNGLPAEFYKTIQDVISTTMLEVLNEVLTKNKVPDSCTESVR